MNIMTIMTIMNIIKLIMPYWLFLFLTLVYAQVHHHAVPLRNMFEVDQRQLQVPQR